MEIVAVPIVIVFCAVYAIRIKALEGGADRATRWALMAIAAFAGLMICLGLVFAIFNGYREDYGGPALRTLHLAFPLLASAAGVLYGAWSVATGRRTKGRVWIGVGMMVSVGVLLGVYLGR
jgi:hypothetical protein